jgi:RHS repeat-associated protein
MGWYDALGNITRKNDVSVIGGYHYGEGGAGPHQLTSIQSCGGACQSDVIPNGHYVYDANGNLSCVTAAAPCDRTAARVFAYSSFNMVTSIGPGSGTPLYTLAYDPDHARAAQTSGDGTVQYFNDPAGDVIAERYTPVGGTPVWQNYLVADGRIVMLRTVNGGSVFTKYYVTDHLGSVAVSISSNNGQVYQRFSYDAWGHSRDAAYLTPDPSCTAFPQRNNQSGTRGFTGAEELRDACLVNLNARLYNPTLGRFMVADPTRQNLYDLQELNPYAYVDNNPLSLTDPTGYGGKGGYFKTAQFRQLVGIAAAALLSEFLLPEIIEPAIGWSVAAGSSQAAIQTVVNAGISGGGVRRHRHRYPERRRNRRRRSHRLCGRARAEGRYGVPRCPCRVHLHTDHRERRHACFCGRHVQRGGWRQVRAGLPRRGPQRSRQQHGFRGFQPARSGEACRARRCRLSPRRRQVRKRRRYRRIRVSV